MADGDGERGAGAPAPEPPEPGAPRIPAALVVVLGVCVLVMVLGALLKVGLLDVSLPGMFMGLASVVFLLALTALWQSLRTALGGGPELTVAEVGVLTDRSALEDEKVTLLRAIKDITYEHTVGKISDEDFTRLNAAYRQRAKEVLRLLDQDLAPFIGEAKRLLDAKPKKSKPQRAGKAAGKSSRAKARSKKARARAALESADADLETKEGTDSSELATKESSGPEARAAKDTSGPEANESVEVEAKETETADRESADDAGVDEQASTDGASDESRRSPRNRPKRTAKNSASTTSRPDKRICGACGVANDPDATFCKACAARVAPVVCPACDTENDADARFCKRCAGPLASGDEEE